MNGGEKSLIFSNDFNINGGHIQNKEEGGDLASHKEFVRFEITHDDRFSKR